MTLPDYHIRVDTDLPKDDIIAFFSNHKLYDERQFTRHIVCREVKKDGTVHIHACVRLAIPRNTLRDRIKSYFKTIKSSDFSVSKRRKKSLESYVMKDGCCYSSEGYTEDEIIKFRESSFQKGTKGKVKSSTMMGQLVVGMKDYWKKKHEPHITDYARFIYIHYLTENRIVPSDFKMKDMAWTLKALYLREYYGVDNMHQLIDYKIRELYPQEYDIEL